MRVGYHNIHHCQKSLQWRHTLSCHFLSTLNTVVTVGFQPNAYMASEAFGVVIVCAALIGQTQRDVSVNISISNIAGTAESKQV